MAKAAHEKKGIFCLEGEWSADLKKTSTVRPILELMSQETFNRVPYIHRDVATEGELAFYLSKWTLRKYDGYPILYLAIHGDPGLIYVGHRRGRRAVHLERLAELLRDKCRGRIIVFASCGTLRVNVRTLRLFLKETGAVAICGYRVDVGWIDATAFELLLLAAMQENAFTASGARAMLRRVKRQTPHLMRELNFRMLIRGD
jgi:hypothetical protein